MVDPERFQPKAPNISLRRARVLVIDDEPDILQSLKKRLTFAGYEFMSAADGIEATKLALNNKPDVIVLDIGLPGGDGHQVAQRVRNNTHTMFTPIIYLTARTAEADRETAQESGAFAYFTKPFKSEELLEAIHRAVGEA